MQASADLRLCNKTEGTVSAAIGYREDGQWITEGWWNLSKASCDTVRSGDLQSRYFYIYAVENEKSGEWSGPAHMCVSQKEFTIQGIENCVARGYERVGFFEIDTNEQDSWTVQLTEPTAQGTSEQ
ncbi:DUF1036 domain-containing protein [Flexibacterium corallicola]|uniref:DUF1036 domain-containing protein n=1 Tax=Flexibacterium corallicola TaxID=3037259 RepID=UPI00286F23DC|nr:DUF1036 domain-containing protein [Pseudovibrio sp. M1P-2-3]